MKILNLIAENKHLGGYIPFVQALLWHKTDEHSVSIC